MQITDEERAHAIQLLRTSQTEFLDLTSGLTEAQWSYHSALDCWSVGDIAEHLVLSEEGMLSRIRKALSRPPDPDWETKTAAKTAFLEENVPQGAAVFAAPAPLRPLSQWTPEESIARYQEWRAKSLQLAEETKLPLKAHLASHPSPAFGTLNAYQWLIYIPLHNMRHNRQLARTKSAAGFPG